MEMSGPITKRVFAVGFVAIAVSGCQRLPVLAPIHVWMPPRLQSVVGHRVMMAPVAGDAKISGPLTAEMMTHAPRDAGREIVCLDARTSPEMTPAMQTAVRLVSFDDIGTSDIANIAVARLQDADFLLSGEIVRQPSEMRANSDLVPLESLQPKQPSGKPGKSEITVSWKLTDLKRGNVSSGFPIVTTHDVGTDAQGIAKAAAADAWQLITPHVIKESIELSKPRVGFGAASVRQGNLAAEAGDWMSARDIWLRVLDTHPRNHAAMHNLAIASVAMQNFDAAGHYIGLALNASSQQKYRQTAVWIESKQHDFHHAFDLPDPAAGWSAIRD